MPTEPKHTPRIAAVIYGRRVLEIGARAFVVRGPSGESSGSVFVASGVAASAVSDPVAEVLVPKGFGRALLARLERRNGGYVGLPGGEPCVRERWRSAGEVAAWFHSIGAPIVMGERETVRLAIRPIAAETTRIVAVFAEGLTPEKVDWACAGMGMSVILDSRNHPDRILLSGELPPSPPMMRPTENQTQAWVSAVGRLALRLRSVNVSEIRIGISGSIGSAIEVAKAALPGWIGFCNPGSEAFWNPVNAAPADPVAAPDSERGSGVDFRAEWQGLRSDLVYPVWKGPAMPDVDGVVGMARELARLSGVSGTGKVRVGLHGEKGFVYFVVENEDATRRTNSVWVSLIAANVAEHFFQVGPVTAMTVKILEQDGKPVGSNDLPTLCGDPNE